MSKKGGRQRDTAFRLFGNDEFVAKFYERRSTFSSEFRIRVEREAKTRGLRNIQKRKT